MHNVPLLFVFQPLPKKNGRKKKKKKKFNFWFLRIGQREPLTHKGLFYGGGMRTLRFRCTWILQSPPPSHHHHHHPFSKESDSTQPSIPARDQKHHPLFSLALGSGLPHWQGGRWRERRGRRAERLARLPFTICLSLTLGLSLFAFAGEVVLHSGRSPRSRFEWVSQWTIQSCKWGIHWISTGVLYVKVTGPGGSKEPTA